MLTFKQFRSTKSSDFQHLLEHFVDYCTEYLELDEAPEVVIVRDGSIGTAFGCYSEGTIKLNIINRHPMDILRTLAHEVVHYKQDMNNELHELSGETGSEHENEANAMAGVLMRNFGKANPDLFSFGAILESLNEWGTGDSGGGFGGGPGKWHPPTVLRHQKTMKKIKEGDTVSDSRGKSSIITGIFPPRHPGSTGKVTVDSGFEYNARTFGLEFFHV